MGEGVFTSMPMIVAEELACDWTKVRAEYASSNRNIVHKGVYKTMLTGGSSAVRGSRVFLQQAGASARARLIKARRPAAGMCRRPNTKPADSKITRQAPAPALTNYGAVAGEAAKITTCRRAGNQDTGPVHAAGQAGGASRHGGQGQRPGYFRHRCPPYRDICYAAVVTCPVPGGTPISFDAKAVEGLSRRPQPSFRWSNSVAVVAGRFWRSAASGFGDPGAGMESTVAGAGTSTAPSSRADYTATLENRPRCKNARPSAMRMSDERRPRRPDRGAV